MFYRAMILDRKENKELLGSYRSPYLTELLLVIMHDSDFGVPGQMRVLFVDELFPPVRFGGAEISAMDIAAEMGRKDEVVVFTPSYNLSPGFEDMGTFRIFRYHNMFKPIGSIVQQKLLFFREMTKHLASFVRIFKPDILHGQNAMSIPAVAKISEMNKTVGIAHVRDHRFECFTSNVACRSHRDATVLEFARCVENPIHTLIYPYAKLVTGKVRRALVECGNMIAVSEYLKSELANTLSGDIRVVYDGVDLDRIQRIEPTKDIRDLGLKQSRAIFYGGGLHKFKGIFELLKAFGLISRKMAEISLLIAGDGPHLQAVRKSIANNRLDSSVKLLGRLSYEDAIAWMKSSQIVVVPSLLPETVSRVVMEALACGKPIIGSNRGAIPETIGDAGVTVDPSADNIADAISVLMDDSQRLKELSRSALERRGDFSLDITVRQIRKAYEGWLCR
jgi:glycosyltransferase involved in cell wall biosynthesis